MSQGEEFVAVGNRICEMRDRLALNQTQFAARLGVDRKSVAGWESGKRLPDGISRLGLMKVFGADINYLLTGEGGKPTQRLSAEEQTMLEYFRSATPTVRRAAMGALLGAASPVKSTMENIANSGAGIQQVNVGDGAVMIGSAPATRRRTTRGGNRG